MMTEMAQQAYIRRVTPSISMIQSDLQSREEGQQRVHPGASGEQRFVDVNVQQQRGLADVLHYRRIVLNEAYKAVLGDMHTNNLLQLFFTDIAIGICFTILEVVIILHLYH